MVLCQPQRHKLSTASDFEVIVRAHQGAVRAFLRRLTGECAIADELAQDTFIKAYSVWGHSAEIETPRSWLYRIAYRSFLDHKRRRDRRRDIDETRPEPGALIPTLPASSSLALDLSAAMASLPDERRGCAILCLALGHSHAEAAHITRLPLGTVKSHVNRAKIQLKTFLKEYADVATS